METPGDGHDRRSFLRGLGVSASCFAVLSSLAWGVGYGAWRAVALSFVVPPVYAFVATRRGDTDMAVVSWLVSLLVVVCVARGWSRPGRGRTFLAHVALALYWLWAFALMGIGV